MTDPEIEALVTENMAIKTQIASIRKLCESGWPRGEPCRLCKQVGTHATHCYVKTAVGYDLLEEHESTLRENDQLRAALAVRLPVNGKHIATGGKFLSARDRARGKPGRFSSHEES